MSKVDKRIEQEPAKHPAWRRCALPGTLALLLTLGGCMMQETRPLPKVHPIQPTEAIPQAELLDVGVHIFDPGIPQGVETDEKLQQKERIFPDVRRAEARYFAATLRDTLEDSGQWGAVRVIPDNAQFVDVIVNGTIVRSDGKYLELQMTVSDATGRTWIKQKKYQSQADIGSYMSDAALRQRDPFQNVYSLIANDMVAARHAFTSAELREVRRVTELRFAQDLAPDAFTGYLQEQPKGQFQVARLPAESDPVFTRVHRIRERDGALIDTVSDQYDNFSDKLSGAYGNWRRYSYDEISKAEKLKGQARTRMVMGAAAILGGLLASSQCAGGDYGCQSIERALRYTAYAGGMAGILSGLKKRSDAKIHTAAIQELATSFNAEVAPRVVEVEGRTLKLTGSAEDQYREWREMLRQIYLQDTGGDVPAATPTGESAAAVPKAEVQKTGAAKTEASANKS